MTWKAFLAMLVSGILGASAGFYLGFYHAGRPSVARIWAANGALERAHLAYRTGNAKGAEMELLSTLRVLDALREAAPTGQDDPLSLDFNSALQYGRLVVLAERGDRRADAQKYMALALERLNRRGGNFDERAIRELVLRFDGPPPTPIGHP